MRFQKRFFTALLFGASCAAIAFSAHGETLEDAVRMTLETHPSVTTAKTGASFAEEQKREEHSGYFPELAISGQTGRVYQNNSTSRGLTVTRGAAYSYYWDGSLTARQMLFDGFETQNRVQSASQRIKAAGMNVQDVAEQLSLGVTQAYIDLLRAREGLSMIRAHAKKVADYEERIKTMVDDGAADEAEYQQARDIRVILENMAADYEGQVHMAEAYYMELTGVLPGELAAPQPVANMIPSTSEEAIAYARDNHPALKAAMLAARAASYEARAEKGTLYPDVDGELSWYESDKKDVIGGEVTDARAVVRMNWALETGGAQLARIQQKKVKEKEAASRKQEMEREIERSIRLAYAERERAAQQAEAQERRIDLNRKLFETYNIQFEGARISLLQLMQSDNQLFTTQLEKMNGAYKLKAAEYAILAGMGRLREALNIDVAQADLPAVQPAAGSAPLLTRPPGDER